MKYWLFTTTLGAAAVLAWSAGVGAQETSGARSETHVPESKASATPQVPPTSPAGMFGTAKQFAISGDGSITISYTSLSGVSGSTTRYQIQPGADYFIIDNLSLGVFMGFAYTTEPSGHTLNFNIGPRVGYNIPFSKIFSVWPRVGFSYGSTSVKQDAVGSTPESTTTNNAFALNLSVPVLFHPGPHFFFGFGPALDQDLSGDNKATTISGRLTFGGWL